MSGVRLSVASLDLTRERKDLGSPKLTEWKPITRVTREIEVKWSRSPGRLMLSSSMHPGNYIFLEINSLLLLLQTIKLSYRRKRSFKQ